MLVFGLTRQVELAKIAGVSPPRISHFRRDNRVFGDVVLRLRMAAIQQGRHVPEWLLDVPAEQKVT
jgi:hypothetical protein